MPRRKKIDPRVETWLAWCASWRDYYWQKWVNSGHRDVVAWQTSIDLMEEIKRVQAELLARKHPWRIWWGTPVVYSVAAPAYGSTVVYPQPRYI